MKPTPPGLQIQADLRQVHSALIEDPTIADAVLDRLVYNAHRIELSGESMRKQRSATVAETTQA